MRVADIILEQLGGNRFLVMTGASHLVSDGNTLRMNLPRNASRANRLAITLGADDTYTMRFYRYTAGRISLKTGKTIPDKTEEVREERGVYFDMLQPIFEETTHMRTHL